MKYHAINLIRRGGDAIQSIGDGGTAYALHELANNLLLVMQGKETMAAWLDCYVATGAELLDLDKYFQVLEDKSGDYEHLINELSDDECTTWTCPECGRHEYKVFGFNCEECGFDAADYIPSHSKDSDNDRR